MLSSTAKSQPRAKHGRIHGACRTLIILGGLLGTVGSLPAQIIPNPVDKAKELAKRLPSLSSFLDGELPVSTTLDDAVTAVPFLDDFEPEWFLPIGALARNADGTFRLVPGEFEYVAQSYCLKAGGYAPAGMSGYENPRGGGAGYVYAPVAGSRASSVESILRNSVLQPEISQHDIQVLLWAIVASTKISDMSSRMQTTAARLLTPEELFELNDGALGLVPDAVLENAKAMLPTVAWEIFEAEARLRRVLTEADASYDEIERIAVRTGIPPVDSNDQAVPLGRWSYHPEGYYVRYFPSGYSRTRIQISVPGRVRIVRDPDGRITQLADALGNLLELTYDDSVEPTGVTEESETRGFVLGTIRLVRSDSTPPLEIAAPGWLLSGVPSGEQRPPEAGARFARFAERYQAVVADQQRIRDLVSTLRVGGGPITAEEMRDLLELGDLSQAIGVAGHADSEMRAGAESLVDGARQWFLCVLAGGCAQETSLGLTNRGGPFSLVLASGLGGAAEGAMTFDSPTFDPADQIGTPGSRGRQRLGQSGRCEDLEDGTPCVDCSDLERQLEGLRGRNRALGEMASVTRREFNAEVARRHGARDGIYGINGSAANYFNSVLNLASAGKGKLASAAGNVATAVTVGQGDFGALAGEVRGRALEAARKQRIGNAGASAMDYFRQSGDASGATRQFLEGVRGARWIKQGQRVAGALNFGQGVVDYWNNTNTVVDGIGEYFDARREAQNKQKELDDIDARMQANLDMMQALRDACQQGQPVGLRVPASSFRLAGYTPVRTADTFLSLQGAGNERALDGLEDAYEQFLTLQGELEALLDRFDDLIFPPLSPFLADEWQNLDPAILMELLRIVDPELQRLLQEYDVIETAGRSAHDKIQAAKSAVYGQPTGAGA